MVTEIQRETVKVIGSENQFFNPNLANPAAKQLGISQNALSSRVGGMFKDFEDMATIIEENFPIFERRFKARLKVKPDLYRVVRSIARKMKK